MEYLLFAFPLLLVTLTTITWNIFITINFLCRGFFEQDAVLWICMEENSRGGRDGSWVKALTALAEDWGLVLNPHMGAGTHVVRNPQAWAPSLYPLGILPSCPPYVLRPGLSLNLELPGSSRLPRPWAPVSSLNTPNPGHWDYRHAWLSVGAGDGISELSLVQQALYRQSHLLSPEQRFFEVTGYIYGLNVSNRLL